MRKFIGLVLLVALTLPATSVLAQKKQKFGHIDSNELLKLMPGRDSAVAKIQDYAKLLEKQLMGMEAELDSKYQDYLANEGKMTELIKQTRQRELQDIQSRIEAFRSSAQEDLDKKQSELLAPIIDKAKAAIEKVAKENGYTYVFDSGLGILLYEDPTEDIMPLVKKELGLN